MELYISGEVSKPLIAPKAERHHKQLPLGMTVCMNRSLCLPCDGLWTVGGT